MRINQYIAAGSSLSRRAADTAVAGGRVTVDGQPATVGQAAPPGADIRLDGRPVHLPDTHTYLLLHKPVGYVSSRVRQGSDPTIYELLPGQYHRLRAAGRLDRDSSGLMLLTDDGDFIQRHTHPSYDKSKIYELVLVRALNDADRAHLETGVDLEDGPSQVHVLSHDGRHVTVSLGEGRNRQLRRTFGALGYTVERLHRTHLGNYELGRLPSGQFKIIQPDRAQIPESASVLIEKNSQ